MSLRKKYAAAAAFVAAVVGIGISAYRQGRYDGFHRARIVHCSLNYKSMCIYTISQTLALARDTLEKMGPGHEAEITTANDLLKDGVVLQTYLQSLLFSSDPSVRTEKEELERLERLMVLNARYEDYRDRFRKFYTPGVENAVVAATATPVQGQASSSAPAEASP